MVGIERNRIAQANPDALTDPATDEQARKIAAARVLESYPEASGIPEISRWLTGADPVEQGGETVIAPEGPTAPATAPVAPQATTPPTTTGNLPQRLPSGATLVKDNGDGTSEWKRPDGTLKTYPNKDVIDITRGAEIMKTPPPDMSDILRNPTGN
jgi:hypothetical protein